MRKEWRWMGNVVMGDEKEKIESYQMLKEKHLQMMVHSILGTQQIRSQSLAKIKKSSIIKTQKEQSFKKTAVLQETNKKTDSYTEFEKECIKQMKAIDYNKQMKLKREVSLTSVESDDLSNLHSVRTQKRAIAISVTEQYEQENLKPSLFEEYT